jgi:hypothetical protein
MPEYIYRHNNREALFYIRAQWELKYVWWPQRCEITGRRLWPGTRAYRGRAVYTGPGTDAVETRWHDKVEHLIWQLKE